MTAQVLGRSPVVVHLRRRIGDRSKIPALKLCVPMRPAMKCLRSIVFRDGRKQSRCCSADGVLTKQLGRG
jgi:hypothetical protein